MKIELTFLQSKFGRRLFALFIMCALIPISALAAYSYLDVRNQLWRQSADRLYQASKGTGMSIYERLLFLEGKFIDVTSELPLSNGSFRTRENDSLLRYFTGITFIGQDGSKLSLMGSPLELPNTSVSEASHIATGKTLIRTHPVSGSPAKILMIRAARPDILPSALVIAELNPDFLWETISSEKLPQATDICVLDSSNDILFSTIKILSPPPRPVISVLNSSTSGQISWSYNDVDYYGGYWSIFLEPAFSTPMWTVLLNEEKSHTLVPIASFRLIFSLIALLSFLVVLLLSSVHIKRNLVPLGQLQTLTKKVAQKDFESRVHINSGDEFEELGKAFNAMAEKLGQQFRSLDSITEIHQALLSAASEKEIAEIAIGMINGLIPSDCTTFACLDPSELRKATIYERARELQCENRLYKCRLTAAELGQLRSSPLFTSLTDKEHTLHYLTPLRKLGYIHFLLFPVVIKSRISGILALGYKNAPLFEKEYLLQIRQVVDQIGVALSNARLIEQLDELNWGTMTALARAVDAKSSWTAGHTERVTTLAVELGKRMGLSGARLDDLHRSALLHDIGKIGVPRSILDKPGALTDEEYSIVKMHSSIGARILEPIAAYSSITPIVLQHHERYDGKGYPHGLLGEDITLEARILAVADVFDAVSSDRPYRAGMELNKSIDVIRQNSGSQFDPKIVEFFLNMMAKENEHVPEAGREIEQMMS